MTSRIQQGVLLNSVLSYSCRECAKEYLRPYGQMDQGSVLLTRSQLQVNCTAREDNKSHKRKLSPKACIQPLLPDGLCWGHIHGAWAGVGPNTGLWWGCGNCGGYASCWPPTVSGLPRPYFWDLLSHIQTGLLIAMPRFVSLKDHEPPSMKSFIKSCCLPGFWGWTSSLLP